MGFSLQVLVTGLAFTFSCVASAVTGDNRDAFSPSSRNNAPCLAHCSEVGPNPRNWFVYQGVEKLGGCSNLLIDFSIFDNIDDLATQHGIRACTVWGADWNRPGLSSSSHSLESNVLKINATYTAKL